MPKPYLWRRLLAALFQPLTSALQWEYHNFGFPAPKDDEAIYPDFRKHVEKKLVSALARVVRCNGVCVLLVSRKVSIETRGFSVQDDTSRLRSFARKLRRAQQDVEIAERHITSLWNMYAERDVLDPSWKNDRQVFRNRYESTCLYTRGNVLTKAFE